MSTYKRINNTINDAYRVYYGMDSNKSVKIDVQITQDNKIVVHLDDVHNKRLKHLRKNMKNLVTLEEFLKHTPDDLKVIIEINRFDDKDYAYRIVHFAEINYSKEVKLNKFIYASTDKKFCKHIQCMRRPVFHVHKNIDTLDPYYNQIGITVEMLKHHPEAFQNYEGVYVINVNEDDISNMKDEFPWVKGWISC